MVEMVTRRVDRVREIFARSRARRLADRRGRG